MFYVFNRYQLTVLTNSEDPQKPELSHFIRALKTLNVIDFVENDTENLKNTRKCITPVLMKHYSVIAGRIGGCDLKKMKFEHKEMPEICKTDPENLCLIEKIPATTLTCTALEFTHSGNISTRRFTYLNIYVFSTPVTKLEAFWPILCAFASITSKNLVLASTDHHSKVLMHI